MSQNTPIPDDVRQLVIAAREAWEEHGASSDDLDRALERFSETVPYDDQADPVQELIEMLSAAANEEGVTVFDHTPEEIGLHVMENHTAIRATLATPDQSALIAQLVEALEGILSVCGETMMDGYVENSIHSDDVERVRTALAAARGEG